ncbi:MAG: hypothetical protein EAZ07_05025 [Cytophagales bacterium]|nr:MAG: hypothetical protein EAZ07_05025 [Cytophagales bacterium]
MDKLIIEMEALLKYLAVFGISMVKFVGGPLMGAGAGLSLVETILFTFLGMMASVLLFSTLLGQSFKTWLSNKFQRNKKLFSNKTRRIVRVWNSFGIKGVAFLTPILFTPIVGTLIAASFGESQKRIIFFMSISALFWSVIISSVIYILKNGVQLT